MSNETKVSELETRSLTQIENAGLLPVSVPNVNTYAVPVNGITNAISAAQTVANNAQTAANSATSAASTAQVTANSAAGAAAIAQTTANAAIPPSQRGVAGGVASLDAAGKVPAAQLPSIGGEVDPPDLVSEDAANALGIGQDGKLFVPTADAGGITDVKVNGASVVSGSVANIINMATSEDVSAAVTLAEEYTDTAIETVRSEIPDISGLAGKNEIPDVSNLASKDEIPDVSDFASKSDIPDVSNLASKDDIPDVSEFVKESNIIEAIETHNESLSAHDDIRYVLEVVDLKIPAMIHVHDTSDTAHTDIRDVLENIDTEISIAINVHNTDNSAHDDIREVLEDVHTEISTAVSAHNADNTAHTGMREDISILHDALSDMETDVKALDKRIDGLESLGRWGGTFLTFSDVPTATLAFKHISENDFVYVDKDENHDDLYSRYFVAEISDAGVITWGFDRSWSDTDTSNKMDKLLDATTGNLIAFDENGNAKDSEYKPADFVNNLVDQQLQVKLTFDDTITFNDIKVERIEGHVSGAIFVIFNAFENEYARNPFIYTNHGRIVELGDPVDSQDAAIVVPLEMGLPLYYNIVYGLRSNISDTSCRVCAFRTYSQRSF